MNCNNFTELKIVPNRIVEYYDERRLSNLAMIPYFGFNGAPLGPHIYLGDEFISHLNDTFPILYSGVVHMRPYTIYDWHVDSVRTVAINMLLSAHDTSHSIFDTGRSGMIIDTQELIYKPNTMYIFNTQVPHMVVNTRQERYLFTIEFKDPISYDELVHWTKENKYV